MTEVKLTFSMPYDTPNRNGTVFTKEAIEDAVNQLHRNRPIIYEGDNTVIGTTTETSHIATWDDKNNVCKITVNGVIFDCDPILNIKESENNKISSFQIVGFGLTR